MYRESGKLVLASHGGPVAVAYLGTPDGIAYRIYMVVIGAIETLMPRFSAIKNRDVAQGLVLNATRLAMTVALVLFIPLAALMPDLLRLWIGQEFAREGALVGQLLAASFVAPAAFAPIATFYRGRGRPAFVTVVMAFAGVVVLLSSLLWAPSHGAVGVGYGYLLSCVAWLFGLVWGWSGLFGRTSMKPLILAVGVPLALAALAFAGQVTIRHYFGEIGWLQLVALGVAFSGSTFVLVLAADLVVGDRSLSKQLVDGVAESNQIDALRRRVQVWQTRWAAPR
jgi:O-antigen/teichoic acid export membrane protein